MTSPADEPFDAAQPDRVVDVTVPAAVIPWADWTATGAAADAACDATTAPFTGDEALTGLYGAARPALLVDAQQVDPSWAVGMRGMVVVNRAGRVGITVGAGRVLEPAGRAWAITADPATRWVAAYRPAVLEATWL